MTQNKTSKAKYATPEIVPVVMNCNGGILSASNEPVGEFDGSPFTVENEEFQII